MADRDDDRNREIDAAIRRLVAGGDRTTEAADTVAEASQRAEREALEHTTDATLAADMDAVRVPMNSLLKAAGLTEPLHPADDPEASRTFFQTMRDFFGSPRVAYVAAVAAVVVALLVGQTTTPEKLAPQQVVLQETLLVRGEEPAAGEPMREIVVDPAAETVDLRVERPVDPDLPIRYRAVLQEVEADTYVNIAYTSDNRRFAPGPDGMAYPVYRVPAYLLRPGRTYRLIFEPVRGDGKSPVSRKITARFQVVE